MLRSEAERIGFTSNFTIFDASDSANLVRLIIKEMQLDDKVYRPGAVHGQISRAKNGLLTPGMYAQNREIIEYDRLAKRPQLHEIYRLYQNRLKAANSMDFDDLLLYTNILLRDNPDVLENYRNRFQFTWLMSIRIQFCTTPHRKTAGRRASTAYCVVGDDEQSIYSFRGANIDNILKFKSTFPQTRILKLEQNYRSTKNIVNAANSLIKKNKEQIFKEIFSENEEGEKIEVVSAFSDFEEGVIVANKIARMRFEEHARFSDIAILYRTNAQSRIFEESLRKKNIPYIIYGGLSFYQRKEIKDIISYFRLIVNPGDEEAFRRVVNYPARGIGDVTVRKLSEKARLHNVSLWEVISSPLQYNLEVNAGTARKLGLFHEMIGRFIAANETMSAFELAQMVIKETGIARGAYEDLTPEGMSRTQNIQELVNAINEFVSEEGGGNDAVGW